jgi:hypothetical protein
VREKIRTPDTLVRSQVLYPAELHTHNKCSMEHFISYSSFWYLSIDFLKSFEKYGEKKEIVW